MPDDVRTSDPDFSLESLHPSATMDRDDRNVASAPASFASTPADSTPTGTTVDEPLWVEVTCGGCRRGLRVRVDYLGRFVICQHCGQRFLARGAGLPEDGKGPEDGSINLPIPGGTPPSSPGPRDGLSANGSDGFEKLAARIRREHRLERSPAGPRDEERVEGGEGRGAGPSPRPRESSDDRLTSERDLAHAEAARLTADLDGLRARLAGLEARLSGESRPVEPPPPREPGWGDIEAERRENAAAIGRLEGRVRALEGELDRERAELGSAMIRHREDLDQLEESHAAASARWEQERAGHLGAIERAILQERSSGAAEREALRTRLELAQARSAEEIAGLIARVEQGHRSADEVGQAEEAAIRRVEGLQQERDALIERCGELEARARDLETGLAARREEARAAAEAAERLHRDRVDGLSRDLEQAREREEAARARIEELEGRAEGLQAALELERERSAAELMAVQGDQEDRAARLSGELAEARGRADRDAAKLASLASRVEELLSSLGREFERAEIEKEAQEGRLDAVQRQAERDRTSLEGEIAGLRRAIEDAEKGRDAERERAAGLASGAEELAARLAAVEPALASLRPLEAEVARQSAELALARAEAASASRRAALLLEQVGTLRAERDARRREESIPRPPLDEPSPSPSGADGQPDRGPAFEAKAGPGEDGGHVPDSAPGGIPEPRDRQLVEMATAVGAIATAPTAEAARSVPTARVPGQAREVSITLQGVSKAYQRDKFQIPVLEDLDLSVEQGEFLALMGPSGSGKTTLLNLIAGLDRASSGSIVVHGHELTDLSEAQLTRWRAHNVGFVFQMYNLVPVMTAFRNVELPLLLTRLSRRQRRENALTALRIVGLEGREDHYPRQLSGGQEQRVSIARAIVTDPYLIVADEPTGDLDRKSADEILDLLGSLNREFRKTIVMVTHDPAAARRASRLLHLDKGKLVGDTTQPRIWHA